MVTMKDIAAATGVSVSTVSNAFNRPHRLSAAKRDEIFAVAASLGYIGPHPGAASLRTGFVGAIGFMVTDWLSYAVEDPASTLLLQGIAHSSRMSDTVLSLLPLGSAVGVENPQREDDRARSILQRAIVDGFIAFNLPDDHPAVHSVRAQGAALITVDAPRISDVGWVGIDEHVAARTAAEHLLQLGHARIAVLVDRLSPDGYAGPVSAARLAGARDLVARERLRGYQQACMAAGISAHSIPIIEAGGYAPSDARRAADTLLDSYPACTAVLATSDVMAAGVLMSLADRNIDVPSQMSVVGFDDIPSAARYGLTTIHQPLMDKGRWAADMLFAAIGGTPAGHLTLPWHLQIRNSSGPPPELS